MKLSAAASLLALAQAASAQNITFLTGLLQALTTSGHSQLVAAATQLNSTSAGQSIIAQLSTGSPFVLFAPTDSAFAELPSNQTDANTLTDILAYHVVSGDFTGASSTYPNVTLGRSLLADPQLVQLEGGLPQVVAWATRADGRVHVLNQFNDSTVTNTTTFGNITINSIDHVLNIPESFLNTVPVDNSLRSAQVALGAVPVSVFNQTSNQTASTRLLDVIDSRLRGFTFFAPNNAAFQAASSELVSLDTNQSALLALFQNHHLINGTTVYSPLLTADQNRTSAAGEPLQFFQNATAQYVTSGNTTAQIVQPDVLLPNGVVHVIDRVLLNLQSDATAASSAASSASSSATQTSSATGPIGSASTSATATGTTTATSSGTSSGTDSASTSNTGSGSAATGSGSNAAVGLGADLSLVVSVVAALAGVLGGVACVV